MRYVFGLLGVLFMASTANAQLSISFGFNLDRQPIWGPTGYDHVEYYYLPDIEVYYNVPEHMFYYEDGGRWISRSSLPARYRGYDFYNSYKVVVNERAPYRNHRMYREKYFSYKGRHDQQPIRDSRDEKYFTNKRHPEHNNWVKQQHDNGNDRENEHGNRNAGENDKKDKHDRLRQ